MDAVLQQRLSEGKDGAPYINSHPGLHTPLNHLQIDSKPSSSPTPVNVPSSTATTNHEAHSPNSDSLSGSTGNQQLLKTATSVATGGKGGEGSAPLPLKKEIKQEIMNGEIGGRRRPDPSPSASQSSTSEPVLKQPSPFTISSFLNTSRHNSSIPDSFAQEFHQSVLLSTQEKLNQKKGRLPPCSVFKVTASLFKHVLRLRAK